MSFTGNLGVTHGGIFIAYNRGSDASIYMCNTLLFESHYFLMYIITGSLLAHRAPAIKRTTVPAKAFIIHIMRWPTTDHRTTEPTTYTTMT
jgi:hypothetical protein